ncbi:MAG: NAD(+) synthetase [Candidatus Eremiobacter antarcticus]|nr:NAD+ synthase [Candidatus Eremiobacteraeota bacterium]MBC5808951.1 NAD+ synthase [Candidatus Eremiobacteraeota bacterium]PZR60369.1 MAG: NAD(+) synthetase [Candidatus Eremiobacter sp. RRmetagenome_bin22]
MTGERNGSPIFYPVGAPADPLRLDPALVERWLVAFLKDEIVRRRGMAKAVIGISGGVDSAVVAFLCAKALGPNSVIGVRMPYATSSKQSLGHGGLVIAQTGIKDLVVNISDAVDGYLRLEPDASQRRRGNVMARVRMVVLFDQAAKCAGLPIGTGNKSERMLGYFTWHADDSPPINPIGDLFKTQVWQLAKHLGVPRVIVEKPATADLIRGQTDEDDLGISYERADRILHLLLRGYTGADILDRGFERADVEIVSAKVNATHWKRHLPTNAVVSETAINEFYLRPVDY